MRERIAAAAEHAGRRADDIKLIAVSKNHSVEAIAAAIVAGQRLFGESTAQEALKKIPLVQQPDVEWHFIGHLQSNKAKFIPGHFQWLHSLDSVKLAERLTRIAPESVSLNVLIELNITHDPAKHGVAPGDLFPLLDRLLQDDDLAPLDLRGLTTIAPHGASSPEIRAVFAMLRRLREECAIRYALPRFTELSMGMSDDFEDAIKEGATYIRVGTAIFGQRDYS